MVGGRGISIEPAWKTAAAAAAAAGGGPGPGAPPPAWPGGGGGGGGGGQGAIGAGMGMGSILPTPPPPPRAAAARMGAMEGEKGGLNFAEKIMRKMGWESGRGLGRCAGPSFSAPGGGCGVEGRG